MRDCTRVCGPRATATAMMIGGYGRASAAGLIADTRPRRGPQHRRRHVGGGMAAAGSIFSRWSRRTSRASSTRRCSRASTRSRLWRHGTGDGGSPTHLPAPFGVRDHHRSTRLDPVSSRMLSVRGQRSATTRRPPPPSRQAGNASTVACGLLRQIRESARRVLPQGCSTRRRVRTGAAHGSRSSTRNRWVRRLRLHVPRPPVLLGTRHQLIARWGNYDRSRPCATLFPPPSVARCTGRGSPLPRDSPRNPPAAAPAACPRGRTRS